MEPVEIDKSKNKQNQKQSHYSYSRPLSSSQTTKHQEHKPKTKKPQPVIQGPGPQPQKKGGGNPGTQKHAQQTHLKTLTIVFHTSNHTQPSVHKNSVERRWSVSYTHLTLPTKA